MKGFVWNRGAFPEEKSWIESIVLLGKITLAQQENETKTIATAGRRGRVFPFGVGVSTVASTSSIDRQHCLL